MRKCIHSLSLSLTAAAAAAPKLPDRKMQISYVCLFSVITFTAEVFNNNFFLSGVRVTFAGNKVSRKCDVMQYSA